jgi:malate dehydrogenase (oxaloacetate-decarboxylating)
MDLVQTNDLARRALAWHARSHGKIQVVPKCPVRGPDDFAVWYTPGAAAPSLAIAAQPSAAYEYTNKGNCIAIVSDGTRVLGLGNIGAAAAIPVMEGKALLFKYLGGVDAVPICLDARDPDQFVRIVEALAPSFGGFNLEDIEQPKCFRILDALRARLSVPVWHDDQQGTATVVLAALTNALEVVGKSLSSARIVLVGVGAANVAVYRLLSARGADLSAIVACDSSGILHAGRTDIEARQGELADKWRICRESNGGQLAGGIAEALAGADACIAFSRPGPGTIQPDWIARMNRDAIVFACANPTPEVWPVEAKSAGARIIATGRSDFPNQVNNALCFPGVFRGALDVRAHSITNEMALAAADALAGLAKERGLRDDYILPTLTDPEVPVREAAAVGLTAQRQGIAALTRTSEQLSAGARNAIATSRDIVRTLMHEGLIVSPPATT